MVQCSATAKATGARCRRVATNGYKVCQVHGSGSPGKGRAGGRPIVTGRYSTRLPERLVHRYAEALSDSRLLELRDEIALVDARIAELIERLTTGESGQGWREVQGLYAALTAAVPTGDAAIFQAAMDALGEAVRRGGSDNQVWDELGGWMDSRRKLVESERKHLLEQQQMITIERLMILAAALVESVHRHEPDPTISAAIAADIRGLLSIGDSRPTDSTA